MHTEIIRQLMHNKKYEAVAEFAKINSPNRKERIIVCEYLGDEPRLMKRGDEIYILCNKDITYVQEEGIADSIANGTVFDDANELENTADYMQKTMLPMNAISNKHGIEPKKLRIIIAGVMGRINEDGCIEISFGDVENGRNFLDDITSGIGGAHVNKMCDHYLGIKNKDENCEGHCSLPIEIRRDIHDLIAEIDSITDVDPEDEVTDDDFDPWDKPYDSSQDEVVEPDTEEVEEPDNDSTPLDNEDEEDDKNDDEPDEDNSEPENESESEEESDENDDEEEEEVAESYYDESFRDRHPKRLKPIPRDVVSYITVEMNAIRDSNDQAMIAGYCSAKLELVDFYLTCIDTQDPRYIVPHNKQYLVQMQSELNDLLKRILQIKPINKYDRIWGGIL